MTATTPQETILFIGGPADGHRLQVDAGTPYWQVFPDLRDVRGDLQPVKYRRKWLRDLAPDGNFRDYSVFWSEEGSIIGTLINRYATPETASEVALPLKLVDDLIEKNPWDSGYLGLLRQLEGVRDKHFCKHGV